MNRLFSLTCVLFLLLGSGLPSPAGAQSSDRVRGILWTDTDCDGIRETGEGPLDDNPLGYQRMSLFYIGNDSIPFTYDDSEIGQSSPLNGNPTYVFFNGGGGYSYYIAIRPADRPAGYLPSAWQQGNDPAVDNDLRQWPDGAWATGVFVIPQGTGFYGGPPAVTGIDLGLCPSAALPRPYHTALPLVQR